MFSSMQIKRPGKRAGLSDQKQIKKYSPLWYHYFYVFAPLGVLILGSLAFLEGLEKAMTNNPHPQVNYAIVWTILIGTMTMMLVIRVLTSEESLIKRFVAAYHNNESKEVLTGIATKKLINVSNLLQLISGTVGRPINRTEQSAIEHELHLVESRLHASLDLPQYIAGLMVALGLLGTFIGLLVTLGDTSDLIGQLASASPSGGGGGGGADEMFRNMITSLKKPMVSMGIAFSASMFGLLGSIAMGFSLLATRHATRKLITILNNQVHHIIELGAGLPAPMGRRAEDDMAGSGRTPRSVPALMPSAAARTAERVSPLATTTPAARGVSERQSADAAQASPEMLQAFVGLTDQMRQVLAALNGVTVKTEQGVLATQRMAHAMEVRNQLDEAAARALSSGAPMRELAMQQLNALLAQSEKLDALAAAVRTGSDYRNNDVAEKIAGLGVLMQQTHEANMGLQRELILGLRKSLETQRAALLHLMEKVHDSAEKSPALKSAPAPARL
jgi:hypothetical protein